jgi:hypothetical protein
LSETPAVAEDDQVAMSPGHGFVLRGNANLIMAGSLR